VVGALDIIHNEAEKLLETGCDPQLVAEKLKMISSLGRYKFDCRTDQEAKGSDVN